MSLPDAWTSLALSIAALGLLWLIVVAVRSWYFDHRAPIVARLGPSHRRTSVGGFIQWEFAVENRSSRTVSLLMGVGYFGSKNFVAALGPTEVIRVPHGTRVGTFFDLGSHDKERFRARRQLIAPALGAISMAISDAKFPGKPFETLWIEVATDPPPDDAEGPHREAPDEDCVLSIAVHPDPPFYPDPRHPEFDVDPW
jgi:hypothetical protein